MIYGKPFSIPGIVPGYQLVWGYFFLFHYTSQLEIYESVTSSDIAAFNDTR